MGWRTVVVSKPSKLDLRLGYMVVRDCENTVRVHISEISVLIVENTASSVTTALLNELTKQKIKVIFCDEKQNPSSELVSYYGCHDCSLKLRTQIDWNEINKQTVWTSIVTQKIKKQAEKLLNYIIMVKKYSSVKCFVLLNLHCFFNSKELELIYEELKYQNIEILVIENIMHYKRLESEVIYIIDEDLCEIVDLY